MRRIYLSPSNQTANVGEYKAYGINECVQAARVAEAAADCLKKYDCEILIARQAANLAERGKEANEWAADAYVSIHSNAYNDKTICGTEVWMKTGDEESKPLAAKVLQNVAEITGKSRGIKKSTSLAEANYPTMPHCLVEVDFHTNPEQTKLMVENYGKIGEAIANAIISFLDLELISEPEQAEAEYPEYDQITEVPNKSPTAVEETVEAQAAEPEQEAGPEPVVEEDYKKVKKGTVIRTILLILSFINQIIAVIGSTSFAASPIYQIVSLAVTALIAGINAWENNDWTYFARIGTGVLDALEDGKITKEEALELLRQKEDEK